MGRKIKKDNAIFASLFATTILLVVICILISFKPHEQTATNVSSSNSSRFWEENELEYRFLSSCMENSKNIWDIRSTSKGFQIELRDGKTMNFMGGNMNPKQVIKIAYYIENCALSGIYFTTLSCDEDHEVILSDNGIEKYIFHYWQEPTVPRFQDYFNSFDSQFNDANSLTFNHVRLITENRCKPYIEIRETASVYSIYDFDSIFEVMNVEELAEYVAIMNNLGVEIPNYFKSRQDAPGTSFLQQKSPLLGRTFEFIGINREQSVRMHGLLLPYDGNLPFS